jgi:beta-alanine--pyruvate transaminase
VLHFNPNDLRAFWMPFTANRQFKQNPRMLVGAKDMHFTASDGRKILDGTAGLWCVNAGHCRPKITEAIPAGRRAGLRARLPDGPPEGVRAGQPPDRHRARRAWTTCFFTNSGSESVETALKMALAYHRVKGDGSRTRLIGRERGYHGVNFGGISVGGIVTNRKMFGTLLTGVDHMPHTHMPAQNAFTKGEPEHGGDIADRARAHRHAA